MKDSPEYQKKEIKFEVTTWAIGMVLFFTIFAIFNFVDLNKYQWILIPIVLSIILFFYIVSKKRVSLYKKYHEREDNIIPLDKPLSRGGANFASRRIIFRDNLAHTKDTWFNFVLNNIFLFIAFCLIAVTIYNFLVSHNRLIIPTTFLAVIFSILGLVIKIFTTKHINFDKEAGIYFFGKNNPKTISATQNMQPNNSLGNIKETQIISKFVRGKKSNGFTCYEFNIVLQDNQRFNVLNHSNYRKIFEDAEKLSSFLNVPLSKTDAPKNPVINF